MSASRTCTSPAEQESEEDEFYDAREADPRDHNNVTTKLSTSSNRATTDRPNCGTVRAVNKNSNVESDDNDSSSFLDGTVPDNYDDENEDDSTIFQDETISDFEDEIDSKFKKRPRTKSNPRKYQI